MPPPQHILIFFISLVYLEDGCNPCYPRFVDWHGKINSFLDFIIDEKKHLLKKNTSYNKKTMKTELM